MVVLKIHPDTPSDISNDVEEIKRITLTNLQQTILERTIEPISEPELTAIFDETLSENLTLLLGEQLLGFKEYSGNRLYFITQRGLEALKGSF